MYIIIYHITISHKEKYDDTFYNNQHVLYNMTFSSLYLPTLSFSTNQPP